MTRALMLAALLAASACGSGPVVPETFALGGTADDGSGFTTLSGDAHLIPGAQGGFHVWVKYRVSGVAPGLVHTERVARRTVDDRLVLRAEGNEMIGEASADGYWESTEPRPAFMCPTPIGVVVDGQEIRIVVTFSTVEGGIPLGEAEATVTPHCVADQSPDWCIKICRG